MSKRKVMIVDDDKEILELVSIILEKQDYETAAINSGKKLIEKINEFNPDTILLDIQLGDIDGRMLCKEIKEIAEHSNTSIILFSADSQYGENAKDYLCDDFIGKPFELNELIAIIDKHTKI